MKIASNLNFINTFLVKRNLIILLFCTIILGVMDIVAMRVLSDIFQITDTQSSQYITISKYKFNIVIFLTIILILRFIFTFFATYVLNKIIFNLRTTISSELLKVFLNKIDVKEGAAEKELWKKLVYNESNQLIAYVKPILQIIFDTLLILFICFAVITYVTTQQLTVVMILAIFIFYMTYLTFPIITKWGKMRQKYDGARLDISTYSIENQDTLQIGRLTSTFLQRFKAQSDRCVSFLCKYNAVLDSYPMVIEVVLVLVCVLLINSSSIQESAIAPLGYAALKLLPLVKRILSSAQRIKYGTVAVNIICSQLQIRRDNNFGLNNSLMFYNKQGYVVGPIVTQNRNFLDSNLTYGKVSFPENGLVVICGKNGAGKSTWLQAVAGFSYTKPSSEKRFKTYPVESLYVSQSSRFAATNIIEIIRAMKLVNFNIDSLIDNLKLGSINREGITKAHNLSEFLSANLSGGQYQRFEIGLKLQSEHKVFLLDEPTSEQEKSKYNVLIKYITEVAKNKLVICITHDPALIDKADIIYELLRDNNDIIFNQVN